MPLSKPNQRLRWLSKKILKILLFCKPSVFAKVWMMFPFLSIIKTPLLLIAGKSDEYFNANAYPQIIKNYSKGDAILIDKETHEGILNNNEAILDIKNWLVSNKFVAQ